MPGGSQFIPRPPGARPGDPPPWSLVEEAARVATLERVREVLAGRTARASPFELPGVRASAVLVPLYEHDGHLQVVLTRRADHLRSHRSEVSFPGGGADPDDPDLVATALREAQEEIGLDPGAVEVIGELDHLSTVSSRAFIAPYVGALPERPELTPNPNEVARILHVSVAELLAEEIFREERWGVGPVNRPVFFFELADETVWGATATMLRQLLGLLTGTLD